MADWRYCRLRGGAELKKLQYGWIDTHCLEISFLLDENI